MNKNNVFKIIFILSIVAIVILTANKFVWPLIQNIGLEKKYSAKLSEEKKAQSDIEEESKSTTDFEYDEYKEVSSQDEAERIETYVGTYIKHIENKEYEKAYNLLYDGFKEKYFETLDKFKEYVVNTYPANMYLNAGEIKRYGYYYFIDVTIGDFINLGEENEKKINTAFTVIENDILDFKLSFGI